jgi:hypothetical protein
MDILSSKIAPVFDQPVALNRATGDRRSDSSLPKFTKGWVLQPSDTFCTLKSS